MGNPVSSLKLKTFFRDFKSFQHGPFFRWLDEIRQRQFYVIQIYRFQGAKFSLMVCVVGRYLSS